MDVKFRMFCLKLPQSLYNKISKEVGYENVKHNPFPRVTKTSWIQTAIQEKLKKKR